MSLYLINIRYNLYFGMVKLFIGHRIKALIGKELRIYNLLEENFPSKLIDA